MTTAGGAGGLVRAAGAIVWRSSSPADVEVLVVHRPRYDDWSLPKGKLERGESWFDGARREVAEETGFVGPLGVELAGVAYMAAGRPKLVRFWSMEIGSSASGDGGSVPNDEVDELRWLAPATAAGLVTQPSDRVVLAAFSAVVASALAAEARR